MNNSSDVSSDVFPAETKEFIIVLYVAVGVTCLLSIIGAASIILSFIFFREIRTTSRFLLFNLSIADMITAIAILTGTSHSYKFTLDANKTDLYRPPIVSVCSLETFFGLYGTDSSILWTIALMAYLYISLTCCRPTVLVNRIIVTVSMLLCWGIPLPIVVTFLIERFFGFKPGYSPGYCTIIIADYEDRKQIYRFFVGYWIFLYLSFAVLPILSFIFICHTRCKMKITESYQYLEEHLNAVRAAERKLLFVPVVFMLIRMWALFDGVTFYLSKDASDHYRSMKISAFFVLMAGIGNSAQGFVNAIFFCLLTPAVRYRIKLACCRMCPCCLWHCSSNEPYSSLTNVTSGSRSASVTSSYSLNITDRDSIAARSDRSLTDVSADTFYGSNEHQEDN